jgi:mono/diheme cytochrome c family protein
MTQRGKMCLLGLLPLAVVWVTGCSGTCGNVAFDKTDMFQTYQQNCAGCHGQQLEGKIGPDLRKVGAKLSPEQIKAVIEKGGLGMPAFDKRLDAKQLNELVEILSNEK